MQASQSSIFICIYSGVDQCATRWGKQALQISWKRIFISKMGIIKLMDTQEQIEKDFKDALRAGDEVRKRTLRMVLSSIKLVEVDKGKSLDEAEVLAILQKDLKSHRESIADAKRADRPDLVAETEAEISILEGYLPQSLTHDEINNFAEEAIAQVGADSPQDMGKVMKVLMPRIQGRADGRVVSQTVQQLLSDKK